MFAEPDPVVIRPVDNISLGTKQFIEQLSTPVEELPLISPVGTLAEQFRNNVARVPTQDLYKELPGAANTVASYMQPTAAMRAGRKSRHK